ncbi:hypothetical protein RP319_04605 [Heyndrickxia coagulans]|uniref:hypothetical protein n=1 Tax=Heyndrickxia coagulans TaxID=1398 RepID=UPI0028F7B586|nr:hypothetical protein [Heyndrickxia coagulans]MDT9755463.1 hypothetical protein [Heyndrickxia coagulans]
MYCKQKIKNKNGLPVTECSFARDEKEKNGPGADQNVFLHQLKKTKAFHLSSELSFTPAQKDKSVPSFQRTVLYTGSKRQKRPSFPLNCLLQRSKKTKASQLPPNCPLHQLKKTKASQFSTELSFTPAQKDKTVAAFH